MSWRNKYKFNEEEAKIAEGLPDGIHHKVEELLVEELSEYVEEVDTGKRGKTKINQAVRLGSEDLGYALGRLGRIGVRGGTTGKLQELEELREELGIERKSPGEKVRPTLELMKYFFENESSDSKSDGGKNELIKKNMERAVGTTKNILDKFYDELDNTSRGKHYDINSAMYLSLRMNDVPVRKEEITLSTGVTENTLYRKVTEMYEKMTGRQGETLNEGENEWVKGLEKSL